MKLTNDEIKTTTELMADLFGMEEKMICNLTEQMRYQKIYDYLMSAGARKLGTKEGANNTYTIYDLKGELYLIPEVIFDETDEEWVAELTTEEAQSVSK
ncbi:hypothetical protein [Halanaerobaculum tunisiense]